MFLREHPTRAPRAADLEYIGTDYWTIIYHFTGSTGLCACICLRPSPSPLTCMALHGLEREEEKAEDAVNKGGIIQHNTPSGARGGPHTTNTTYHVS